MSKSRGSQAGARGPGRATGGGRMHLPILNVRGWERYGLAAKDGEAGGNGSLELGVIRAGGSGVQVVLERTLKIPKGRRGRECRVKTMVG